MPPVPIQLLPIMRPAVTEVSGPTVPRNVLHLRLEAITESIDAISAALEGGGDGDLDVIQAQVDRQGRDILLLKILVLAIGLYLWVNRRGGFIDVGICSYARRTFGTVQKLSACRDAKEVKQKMAAAIPEEPLIETVPEEAFAQVLLAAQQYTPPAPAKKKAKPASK